MNTDVTLWDKAESDIEEKRQNQSVTTNEFSEILSSVFIYGRNKLSETIRTFSKLAEIKLEEEIKRKTDYQFVDEPHINFSFDPDTRPREIIEKERKEEIRRKNKKYIDGIISGNVQVYCEIYEQELPVIVRMIIRNGGTTDHAKDIFQDGLIILMENILNKKIEIIESFDTYFYSVCRYLWLKKVRKLKWWTRFFKEYPDNEFEIDYPELDNQQGNYDKYLEAIKSLGEPCKKLLEYYYYRKMDWKEISNELGYSSAGSARNQKYKCLEKIRSQCCDKID